MHDIRMETKTDTHVDAHMRATELKNLNKFVRALMSMHAPTHILPVDVFYHIIMAGRGSPALCCSPKTACNVSRVKKMRKERTEGGK